MSVDALAASDFLDSPSERRTRCFGWPAIVIAVLVAYANSFQTPFVFDGANYLYEPETVRDISSFDKILKLLDKGQTRALVYLTFGIDYRIYKYDERGWHATNTAIHIFAALALYGIARHAFRSWRAQPYFHGVEERAALVVALIWAVHPLNTQSVTYLYQRQESLMGMFYLLTLFSLTKLADAQSAGRRGGLLWSAISVAACAAGMASKEVMITAPLVVLWYDRVFCARSWGDLLRRRGLYYLALSATWGMLYWLMSRTWGVYASAGILDSGRVTPMEYALTQPGVIARYIRLALLPYGLNIDYAWPKAVTWPLPDASGAITWLPSDVDWSAIARGFAVVGGLMMLTFVAMFRAPALGFLGGAFFVVLAPTSSVAPIIDYCFEHRMYLPLAPLLALVVVGIRQGWRAMAARCGYSSVIVSSVLEITTWLAVATLIALTLVRNHDYRSTTALWGDAARKAPENPRAQYNYGVYLQIDGEVDHAIKQYHRCIKLDPNYTDAYLNLGRIAMYRGKPEDAEQCFLDLLEKTQELEGYHQHAEAAYSLAKLRFDAQDPGTARYYLDRLFQYQPEHEDGRKLAGEVEAALAQRRAPHAGSGMPIPTPHPAP